MRPINKLVLGTVQFGLSYGINNAAGKVAIAEVSNILCTARTNGLSTLDTSHAYGDSEEILGASLKNNDYFKIISKIPCTTESVKSIFKETLQRLGKNKLYGYLVHHFDFFKENPYIWNEIKLLQKESLVKKIGFSLYHPSELEYLFLQKIDFDMIQVPYNILDKSFEPYLKELKIRNIEVYTRSVFLQGLFFKPVDQLPPKLTPLKPYLMAMSEFCIRQGITMEELALNGIIHHPDIDGVVIGVDNAVQLQENIKSIWTDFPLIIVNFINMLDVKEKELLNPVNWKS